MEWRGSRLLETMHSWSNFRISHRNRIITSWKPFYIVNKTGEKLAVRQSDSDRKQTIESSSTQPSYLAGKLLRAAFHGVLHNVFRKKVNMFIFGVHVKLEIILHDHSEFIYILV